jgi:hypothetical protein
VLSSNIQDSEDELDRALKVQKKFSHSAFIALLIFFVFLMSLPTISTIAFVDYPALFSVLFIIIIMNILAWRHALRAKIVGKAALTDKETKS